MGEDGLGVTASYLSAATGACALLAAWLFDNHPTTHSILRGVRAVSKIIVDGIEVDVPAEYTLLQACEAAGAEIPAFLFP